MARPQLGLSEIKRVLKPGGKLLIQVGADHLKIKKNVSVNAKDRKPKKYLLDVLGTAGFQNVEVKTPGFDKLKLEATGQKPL